MPDKLDLLFDDLKSRGYAEGKSRQEFRDYMLAPGKQGYENRKTFFDDFKNNGETDLASYEDFKKLMGFRAAKPGNSRARQQVAGQLERQKAASAAAQMQPAESTNVPIARRPEGWGGTASAPTMPWENPEEVQKRREESYGWTDTLAGKAKKNQDTLAHRAVQGNAGANKVIGTDRTMQQYKDRLDYYNATGEELKNPLDTRTSAEVAEQEMNGITTTNDLMAPTVERDEQGNMVMGADGRPLIGATTDENRVAAQRVERKRLSLEDQKRQAEEELLRLREEMSKIDTDYNPYADALSPFADPRTTNGDLASLSQAYEQTRERIKGLETELAGGQHGFLDGVLSAATDKSTWLLGLDKTGDTLNMLRVSEKVKNGEELTDAEKQMLNATLANQNVQGRLNEDSDWLYRSGRMLAEMAPFMGQIFATGGYGSIAAVGTRAGERMAQKLIAKYGTDALLKRVGANMMKATGTMLGDVAAGFASANTTGLGNTINDALERRIGDLQLGENGEYQFVNDEDWFRAIMKAEVSQTKEFATERFGEHLPNLREMNVWFAKRGATARKIARALSGAAGTKVMRKTAAFLRKGGINGVGGEIIEEEIGLPIDVAIGDMTFDEAISKENQWDIIGGMLLTMGAMHATGAILQGTARGAGKVYNTAQYYKYKRRADKAGAGAAAVIGNRWSEMRDQIDGTSNEDMNSLWDTVRNDQTMTNAQKRAVFDYMNALTVMRGYNMGSLVAAKEKADEAKATNAPDVTAVETPAEADEVNLMAAEDAGYNLATPEDKRDAKNMMDFQRQRVEEMSDAQMSQNLDTDPIGTLRWIRENYGSEEGGLLERAIDYVNAASTYRGMIERVRDDIDAAVQQSGREIDQMTNENGMIIPVSMKDDRQAHVISGNVVMLDDGSGIDKAKSDESIIIRDANGKLEMVAPDAILNMGEVQQAEQAKQAEAERITDEMTEQAGNEIEGTLTFNAGDVYQLEYDGQPHQVEIVQDNGDETVAVRIDGAQEVMPMAKAQLQQMYDQQQQARVASMVAEEEQPAENAAETQPQTQQEEQQAQAQEQQIEPQEQQTQPAQAQQGGIPVNEQGEPQYEQASPDVTYDTLVGQIGADATAEVARQTISEAQARLKELDSRPIEGATVQEKVASAQAIQQEKAAAQNTIDYWSNVLGVPAVREQALQEAAAQAEEPVIAQQNTEQTQEQPAEQPVAAEEAQPVEASEEAQPVEASEEVQPIEETQPVEATEEAAPVEAETETNEEAEAAAKPWGEREEKRRQKLRERAKKWVKGSTVKVRLIETVDDVPNPRAAEAIRRGMRVKGWFDPETGEAFIYLPHIRNERDFDKTYVHEVVSHKGMRALLGEEGYNDLCDKVFDAMTEEEQLTWMNYPGVNTLTGAERRRGAADEYIAHLAEDTNVNPNLWNKFVEWLKDAIRNIKGVELDATTKEITDLLRDSFQNMAEVNKANAQKKVNAESAGQMQNGQPIRFSTSSIIEGAGFEVEVDDDGHKSPLTDEAGNVIVRMNGKTFSASNPVTAADLNADKNSTLNILLSLAQKKSTISAEKADIIRQKYADIINMYLNIGTAENGGVTELQKNWLWLGETVFRTIATNGDKQYSYSADITRVCKKNEAVIRAISALQKEQGYGATPAQIMDIYSSTHEEGYQVPCPVCYVFSRYLRNGKYASAAINGMRKYGNHLPNGSEPWTAEQWEAELRRLEDQKKDKKIEAAVAKANEDISLILDAIDKRGLKLLDPKTKAAEKKKLRAEIIALDRQYRAALDVSNQQSLTNWIKTFAIRSIGDKWEIRPDAQLPENMQEFEENALDLRRVAETMTKYPAIQRLRKSGGAAAGKEITFESNNELGELISGVGTSDPSSSINWFKAAAEATTDEEREEAMRKAEERFDKAVLYAKRQSLRGGQRMWSWSDNIESLAPDVAVNLMQMEMLGGALQSYSKQLEGVAMVAAMDGYVNGSLIGKDNGWQEVTDDDVEMRDGKPALKNAITDTITEPQVNEAPRERERVLAEAGSPIYEEGGKKYVLIFDDVIGIDPYGREEGDKHKKGLFDINRTFSRAGNILVGMNDRHVRAAMTDPRIYFIIPWHASGQSVHILKSMLGILGQNLTNFKPVDYTAMQEEKNYGKKNSEGKYPKVPTKVVDIWESHKNETDYPSGIGTIPSGDGHGGLSKKQFAYRELRKAIFDGSVTPEEQRQIDADAFLSQVSRKVRENAGTMTGTDNEFVYPYEYWDENSTNDNADINGARYAEYCRRLGICPKFSGKWGNGGKWTDEGNFIDQPGYWKLLIDRRMYDVNGNFQDLTPTNSDGFSTDLVDPAKTQEEYVSTQVADDEGTKRIVSNVLDVERKRAALAGRELPQANYDMNLNDAVKAYNKTRSGIRFRVDGERSIQGLEGYTEQEIKDIALSEIQSKLEENGIDDVDIKGIAIHGSRGRGTAREDSDLDIVVEYGGNWKEDELFNILNEEPIYIDGIQVDVNPITKGKSGTLEEYMKRSDDYDREVLANQDKFAGDDNTDRKNVQFNIIRQANPRDNELSEHTWINDVSDIKTFDEAFEGYDINEDLTPDYTSAMAKEAKKTGKVKVYSSKEIADGAFVTPSKMEAQNYAGEGKVYSKTVPVGDIAWIDPLQGQYAKTDGDIRFALGGEIGAANNTEQQRNLDIAKEMEKGGKDAKSIWLATGWEKGNDNKWRYEIPDAKVKTVDPTKAKSIEDIVDAPELFATYPQLKDYKVKFEKMKGAGSFNHVKKLIRLDADYNLDYVVPEASKEEMKRMEDDFFYNSYPSSARLWNYSKKLRKLYGKPVLSEEGLRTIVHELQHAIQSIEGFAKGGNETNEADIYMRDRAEDEATYVFASKVAAYNTEKALTRLGRAKMIGMLERGMDGFTEDVKPGAAELVDKLKDMTDSEYAAYVKRVKRSVANAKKAGSRNYTNLSGEVEARNVEARMKMSDEERRNTPPSETENVGRGEQIVRFSVDGYTKEEQQIIDDAKKNGTYMKAPNGKKSNLSPKQWAQVRTENFKKLFGDWINDPANSSKIVDENGEPMVMYHGTNLDFVNKGERFWTFYPDSHFGTKAQAADVSRSNNTVYEVFLNIRNPKRVSDTPKDWRDTHSEYWYPVIQKAKDEGYDGIVYLNEYEDAEHPSDSWIAFRPEQIKSATENNGDYSNSNPDIRFSVENANQEVFVSNALRAVDGIKQEKATGEQWLAMLQKNGGLKAGEDKWLGLSDWLKEQASAKHSPTKKELQDFIREHQIRIEDVNYKEALSPSEVEDLVIREKGLEFRDDFFEAFGVDSDGDVYMKDEDKALEIYNKENGTNYEYDEEDTIKYYDKLMDWAERITKSSSAIDRTRLSYTTDGLDNKREIALTVPTIEPYNEHDTVHFGDAGEGRAVAWIRFGDTTDKERKSVLVIDEIQSKRHQDGREKGYVGDVVAEKNEKAEAMRKRHQELINKRNELIDRDQEIREAIRNTDEAKAMIGEDGYIKQDKIDEWQDMFDSNKELEEVYKQRGDVVRELQDLEQDMRELNNQADNAIPDAPFEKNWHELAMKRMLRLAAEEGYDKIAWTKGEQQAERYNLGGIVSNIKTYQDAFSDNVRVEINTKGSQGWTLWVGKDGKITNRGASAQNNPDFIGKNISDFVGKEIAAKIMSGSNQTIEGDGLRIGGEGMKGFYDEILPRFMNKYGKKWGVKVGEVELPNVEEAGRKMWSVDVTPEMKESVMQGQVMFRVDEGDAAETQQQTRQESESARQSREAYARRQWRRAKEAAKDWTSKLGLDDIADVYDTIEDVPGNEDFSKKKRKAKGWYDTKTGRIVIVMGNHRSPEDVVQTILHEGVAHHGLRQLFGDRFDTFLDNVYRTATAEVRSRINATLGRNGWNHLKATEEYLARLAENTDFERAMNSGWWDKIKSAFLSMLKELGLRNGGREGIISDNELRYILWRSYQNLTEPGRYRNPFKAAENTAMEVALNVGNNAAPRIPVEEDRQLDDIAAELGISRNMQDRKAEVSIKERVARMGLKEAQDLFERVNSLMLDEDMLDIDEHVDKAKADWIREHGREGVGTAMVDALNELGAKYGDGMITLRWELMDRIEELGGNDPDNNPGGLRFRVDGEEEGEDEDYDAGQMTFAETVTNGLLNLAEKNRENVQLRTDAMRSIGGHLGKLRQAMARQREYDKATVDRIVRLAKMVMQNGHFDKFSKYEVNRLMSLIKNAAGKEDITKQATAVVDLLMNHQLKEMKLILNSLMKQKTSKVNSSGVEVQAGLDVDGARMVDTFKKAIKLSREALTELMGNTTDRMASNDEAVADNATVEYMGLQLAQQYFDEIKDSEDEEKLLKEELKTAKEDYEAGRMTRESYKEFEKATRDAIRENRLERTEAYERMIRSFGDGIRESVERAKEYREQEQVRVNEIHHNANSDLQGVPTDEHRQLSWEQKVANWPLVRFFMKPLATFDEMLRFFGSKSVDGKGYLWNRFMGGWTDANDKEWRNVKAAHEELDAKVSEVMGRKMRWSDLFSWERKMETIPVEFWDGDQMKDHELTQGNLLYIYMVNKMADGRMKLRKMGITEEDVEYITDHIDPRFKELADWLQDDFLVRKRNDYNAVHERMFGASMAAIENYFPLKINARSRGQEVEISNALYNETTPSTITGSIIKRKRNAIALDVTGADAFDVVLEHIQQMEHWAAFAEFNRDLKTLLNYKRFQNRVKNMSSPRFGAGKVLWKNFEACCAIAAGSYDKQLPLDSLDTAIVNIAKGVTAAKIAFRIFTAMKQLLSYPAYFSEASVAELAKSTNPVGAAKAWNWAMQNLPGYSKRWQSRQAGDTRLKETDVDWQYWKNKIVETAGRLGMTPNAFVDALTVAMGAKAIYETKYKRYVKAGYSEEDANKKALQDASIAYNETQQSSEGAFTSAMQSDRTVASVALTVFRNASMAYERRLLRALANLKKKMKRGYKEESIEYMTKQMVREGLDENIARASAERAYNRSWIEDIANTAIFGFVMQFAWNLGPYMAYLLAGDDDDEKSDMWADAAWHALAGGLEGLSGGAQMSEILNLYRQFITEDNKKDAAALKRKLKDYDFNLLPLMSDLQQVMGKVLTGENGALNDVVNLVMQSGIGVNPQTITDAAVAIVDACDGDPETSREAAFLLMRIMQVPQSAIDKLYIDEIGLSAGEAKKLDAGELARRYARYKFNKAAPLTNGFYSDAERKEMEDKYVKRFENMLKERLSKLDNEDLESSFDTDDDTVRKYAGKEAAKRLGSQDYYGSSTSEYGLIYQRIRSFDDLNEDVQLQIEQRRAKEDGDEDREKEIKSMRNYLTSIKKELVGGNEKEVMEELRRERKKMLREARELRAERRRRD